MPRRYWTATNPRPDDREDAVEFKDEASEITLEFHILPVMEKFLVRRDSEGVGGRSGPLDG